MIAQIRVLASVLATLMVIELAVGQYTFGTQLPQFSLSCTMPQGQGAISGYLFGLGDDLGTPGPDWSVIRIDLNNNNQVTKLGTRTYPYYAMGGFAADPIQHRIFLTQSESNCNQLLTIDGITGDLLYNASIPQCRSLQFIDYDYVGDRLIAMWYDHNIMQEYVVKVNIATGELTTLATPDIQYIANGVHAIDPKNGHYYVYGGGADRINRIYVVNLNTGAVIRSPVLDQSAASLHYDPTHDRLYGLTYFTGGGMSFTVTQIDTSTSPATVARVGANSETFPSAALVDRALDFVSDKLILPLDQSSLGIFPLSTGVRSATANLPNVRLGPLAFEQLCQCCMLGNQTNAQSQSADEYASMFQAAPDFRVQATTFNLCRGTASKAYVSLAAVIAVLFAMAMLA